MQGWIKLHRCLMHKPIWLESTPEQKVILTTILMMANHQGREWEWKGERYKADPGQFVTSLEAIATKCGKGVTVQNVRTAIKRFEKYEFLTNESTNKNRLITIVNWGLYQGYDDEPNKQGNKQLTSNQQATNKQLTTNKNVKNDKNDKEKDIASQIKDLRQRYSDEQLKALDDYFEMIRHTRSSGKVADSVILKTYQQMDKYPAISVEYGIKEHTNNPAYHSRKENYTLGIIRNTKADEAKNKLEYRERQQPQSKPDKPKIPEEQRRQLEMIRRAKEGTL